MRIAIDAMGGDHAPASILAGSIEAARHTGASLILVGPVARLERWLTDTPLAGRVPLTLVEAPDVVAMADAPAEALRRAPRATVRVAAELVARGEADAMFTAGHTGAAVIAAHGVLGMQAGFERPALAATLPSRGGTAVLVDAGANAACRAPHLRQFAIMGRAYATLLGVEAPRVGLLSIGEEATKGNELTRQAHRLLRESEPTFVGNVEAAHVYAGRADVIVCDGFTGNVALKISEGLVELVEQLVAEQAGAAGDAGQHVAAALGQVRRRLDYSEYGGAPLLGLRGVCVVGHGRSSAKAVCSAVSLAGGLAAGDLVGRVARALGDAAQPGCHRSS